MEEENSTNLVKARKHDKRQESIMHRLRHTIVKKHKTMRYKFFERMCYTVVIVVFSTGLLAKHFHDNAASSAFSNVLALNNLGYSLMPASTFYKQSVRRDILNDLNPNESNYYGGTFINWVDLNYSIENMVTDFIYVPEEYTGQKRPWNNGTDAATPQGTYSLLTYSFLAQSTAYQIFIAAATLDDFRGTETLALWDNLEFYTSRLYNILMEDFEQGIGSIDDKLYYVRLFLHLTYIFTIVIVAGTGAIFITINLKIDSQVDECSELLLKLDKTMVHRSLAVLRANLSVRDSETRTGIRYDMGEDHYTNLYKMKAVDANILNSPDLQKEVPPGSKVKKQVRARMTPEAIIHSAVNEDLELQQNNKIYSTFVKNYKSKKLFTSKLLLLASFLTILLLSCLTNLLIFYITYYRIKDKLVAVNGMNAVSNSINRYGGLLYKQYHILDSPDSKPLNVDERPLSPSILGYQSQILDTQDDYLRGTIRDTDLCLLLKPVVFTRYYDACRENTGFDGSFSMYSALTRVLSYYQELADLITRPSRPALKTYVEQKTVADNELLTTFCLIALRKYSEDYTVIIKSGLAQRVTLTDTFMWMIYIELFIGSLIYWRVWTRRKLQEWHSLMHTYMVMNDHLLDNEYLKAYFSFRADYSQ